LSDRKLKPLPPDPFRHQDSAIALGALKAFILNPLEPIGIFRAGTRVH
jgi:hypothetical protein